MLDKFDELFWKINFFLVVLVGKLLLILLFLFGGVFVGCEGLIVYVGVSLMYLFGCWFGFKDLCEFLYFLLVGGVVGIVVVFNILLVGIVFVIEEFSGCFEYWFFGILLIVVIVGGVVLLGLFGNYIYFGYVSVWLLLG